MVFGMRREEPCTIFGMRVSWLNIKVTNRLIDGMVAIGLVIINVVIEPFIRALGPEVAANILKIGIINDRARTLMAF